MLTSSERIAAHVAGVEASMLASPARQAVQTFTLDTIGVGIAGAAQPYARVFAKVFGRSAGPAPQWGAAGAFAPREAAAVNAFQAHCQEFDCVHEAAVLHPFTVVTPVLLAEACASPMDGETFIAACAAGVDVAAGLGLAAKSQIKFFRPATCGLFGAVAALSRARRLDGAQITNAFGYALAFAAGTMQAHVEGTPALAASVGHAARAAFDAVDLAQAGMPGPKGALDGPFGYLALFESEADIAPVLESLGQVWRVAQVSLKPFPTGRAAHGGIDMVLRLREQGLTPDALESLVISAPPLIHHLVGRPIVAPLEVNYARLCLPYCAAHGLRHGGVGLEAFAPAALEDRDTHILAQKISVEVAPNPDPAAFTPQRARAVTRTGARLEAQCDVLLGAALRPLSPSQHHAKFRACATFAGLPNANADALISAVWELSSMQDVARLARLAGGAP